MPTKYQTLVDYVAAQTEKALTLSFAEIEAIVGAPLPNTMQVDMCQWKGTKYAYVWRLKALGWRATLDRRNRCVHFARNAEELTVPSGHKTNDVPSRYQPLIDFLAAATGDEMTLTYKEVAALVGPLPIMARYAPAWWGATPAGRYMYTHAMD